ncbi:MAG: tRNA (N(6)-L-threonylcarbamoyladenosine(37)-C(2))-methylthiotransferase MtaB [Candidatus Riflebacteria bacterium]|nr:tRNA (N(6)-L-threonylcarbamoyladenosine(37)-C(2))-methylthiotransferase MtaB [Candidatus Riflebacteria bacterium]
MKRVAVRSLGCKLNTHEGGIIKELLNEAFVQVPWDAVADYYILNTCAVTARAEARARNYIRSAHRRNPEARILVTGCYAQTRAADLEKMPEVWAVVGNVEKESIPKVIDLVESGDPVDRVAVSDIWRERTLEVPLISSYPGLSRPFVKIQDGCNEICSFCKIPMARGRNRSSPPGRVLEQVAVLVADGKRAEIVFAGVHMGCYGEDLAPPVTLEALIARVLALADTFRIRLSSVEPNHLTEGLVDFLGSTPRVCRHLHLPLQSGDDAVLARMRRRYTAAEYARKVQQLRARVPEICLGADVIVGFPGETDASFERTLARLGDLPLAYLHVFPYSRREGTAAAAFRDQVPDQVKTARGRALRELSGRKWRSYASSFIGRTMQVVIISESDEEAGDRQATVPLGMTRCLTDNYIDVLLPEVGLQRGTAATVRITGMTDGEFATGELVPG